MAGRPREITLRFLAATGDVNFFGNVHGGIVMKWIDEAAYACAVGWSGTGCVTLYVGGIRFYRPIHIGDLVEVRARLVYTGTTSMHVIVDVRAGSPRQSEMQKTTHCVTVFVALDEAGKPVAVNPYEPQTGDDRALRDYAVKLMELRRGIEEEMQPHLSEW
jgi:acyl-CoA hydrolase